MSSGLKILLISCLVSFPQSNAQSCATEPASATSKGNWLLVSAGAGSGNDLSLGLSYNWGDQKVFQLGVYTNTEIAIMNDKAPYTSAFVLGMGCRSYKRFMLAALFVGPAWVRIGERRENASFATYSTLGLVVNGQWLLRPLTDFGVGIDLFCNVNAHNTVWGSRLSLWLGNGR